MTQFARWAAATKQPLELMLEGLDLCAPSDSNREPIDYRFDAAFWAIVGDLELVAL